MVKYELINKIDKGCLASCPHVFSAHRDPDPRRPACSRPQRSVLQCKIRPLWRHSSKGWTTAFPEQRRNSCIEKCDRYTYVKSRAGQIPESDQIKQFKEFLGTYSKLTETCFIDCIKDFTTRDVKPEATTCSEHCLQKYLKMAQTISMRFQEYHIQQNEALAAKAGLLGQPR
ncbi:mitochondrial import inner membrane translocase subunit Tim9-like [Ochotona curzoniae]|uniref:mitochondrial import inner membrane translocase subunit Tim9-like n=1 Tax=Ochotona curzoniae TaxID=130825 RepID=UPI001B351B59|nr:mitochondrial import inner membrane translocase subunit Tim9-like [Ochotona curzoniae]